VARRGTYGANTCDAVRQVLAASPCCPGKLRYYCTVRGTECVPRRALAASTWGRRPFEGCSKAHRCSERNLRCVGGCSVRGFVEDSDSETVAGAAAGLDTEDVFVLDDPPGRELPKEVRTEPWSQVPVLREEGGTRYR